MSNIVVALGLVLVIEGTLWALAPGLGRRLLQTAAETPESNLRLIGAAAVTIGVLVIWLVRG
ncbi:MAG TPA: DUF2065 domain-containing protein [Methyloceanibacter sp.]|jgi:uncharacterized protein YjeT (DUF2065 family)|nr:DUF2065 domain-containing protein [Methyloceanibacter sp.]